MPGETLLSLGTEEENKDAPSLYRRIKRGRQAPRGVIVESTSQLSKPQRDELTQSDSLFLSVHSGRETVSHFLGGDETRFRFFANGQALSAHDLAEQIKRMYGNTYRDRKDGLEHIYLLSCEATMGNPCLAQQLAEKLAKDFPNIQIHAIAHPVGVPQYKTSFEINAQTNFLGNEGDVQLAYSNVMPRATETSIPVGHRIAALPNTDDMRDEFHKPWNTFTANGPEAQIHAATAEARLYLVNSLKSSQNYALRTHEELDINLEQAYLKAIQRLEENSLRNLQEVKVALDALVTELEEAANTKQPFDAMTPHKEAKKQAKHLKRILHGQKEKHAINIAGIHLLQTQVGIESSLFQHLDEFSQNKVDLSQPADAFEIPEEPPEIAEEEQGGEESQLASLLHRQPQEFKPIQLKEELEAYIIDREKEGRYTIPFTSVTFDFSMHWDFLFLKAITLSVCQFFSGDKGYYTGRQKENKIAAAEYLKSLVNFDIGSVRPDEPSPENLQIFKDAASSGRLKAIVDEAGGWDDFIRQANTRRTQIETNRARRAAHEGESKGNDGDRKLPGGAKPHADQRDMRRRARQDRREDAGALQEQDQEEQQPKKKGWFGGWGS